MELGFGLEGFMVCALGLRAQGPLDMPQNAPLSFPKSNLRTRNQNPNPQLPLFPKIEPEDQKSESKSSTSADSAPLNPASGVAGWP